MVEGGQHLFFFKLTQEIGKNPAKSRIVKSGQGGGSGGQFFPPLIECLLFRKSALKCPFLDENGRFFCRNLQFFKLNWNTK